MRQIRYQPRVKGGRQQLSAGFVQALEKEVRRQARLFGCSRSFVIATATAHALGVVHKGIVDYKQETYAATGRARSTHLRKVR